MKSGQYVKTFAEASHALPEGMPMNADYPFMLPVIVSIAEKSGTMIIRGNAGKEAAVQIVRQGDSEVAHIEQRSSFERLFNRPAARFELRPFKDSRTPAIGERKEPRLF